MGTSLHGFRLLISQLMKTNKGKFLFVVRVHLSRFVGG